MGRKECGDTLEMKGEDFEIIQGSLEVFEAFIHIAMKNHGRMLGM